MILDRLDRKFWSLDHAGRWDPQKVERSDAARNRRRVLETARDLFAREGATQVTMEEIAHESGVGKGTLYRKFPHKGLLCQALLDEPTRELQGEVMRRLAEPRESPLGKLDWFLDRTVRFTEENLELLYGGQECLSGAERLNHLDHPANDWLRWTILTLLRQAIQEGELDGERDAEYLADALLAPLDVDRYYRQRRLQGLPVERISAGLRSLVPQKNSHGAQ